MKLSFKIHMAVDALRLWDGFPRRVIHTFDLSLNSFGCCFLPCSRYIVYCLMRLEISSASKLQENCSSEDTDAECVATKKTKLLGSTCTHTNECHIHSLHNELDYCKHLLADECTAAMQWQNTLIRRHLAWTHRLCQSQSSSVACFYNCLSV